MAANRNVVDRALAVLRTLPRVSLGNLKDAERTKKSHRGRGIHGGKTHGFGSKGSKARQNFMPLGYETGNTPFYLRFGMEQYYKRHRLEREYPPVSLLQLQKMIDLNRLDFKLPIDLTAICNTGLYKLLICCNHHGVNLTDEGFDIFKAKVNIEVQWASEPAIAAIERNGGTITTSYYDPFSLHAVIDPANFFLRGDPIPKRMIPPDDAIAYYTSAENRGYLADPEKVSQARLALAQKYGYELPKIEDDPDYEMLTTRKDPRQIFYGLEPGWVISLKDKAILKPKDKELLEYYRS
ncbi:large ribosomal subunit protein uL15m [Neocloeon triangulifer]|uniref:large ribosomal subunit protein uL15m n=1 Tax=Neocloeon triangulifer TaxID=2078957 RepID=UPI00286EF80A|nr:large ribosomal subunit protein uL15m [Neocloeon triangulifer]